MDLTNPKIIIAQLAEGKLRTKKYLGQHFLVSRKILEQVIKAADLSNSDTVLEVGPGLRTLTIELAGKAKKVIAVEKDKSLIPLLQKNLNEHKIASKVEILNKDVLKLNTDILPKPYKLVANLPYQITSLLLWKFLHESENKPTSLTIMIQREVAERLLAKPGVMSLLSVLAQYYGRLHMIVKVKSTQFFPAPKVNSAVVKIELITRQQIKNQEKFFNLVKAGFTSKRKKLKNNLLSLGFTAEQISTAIAKTKLKGNERAQELSVGDWIKLYQVLYNNK